MERRHDALEGRKIAAQLDEIALAALQTATHDVRYEVFLQPHVGCGIIPGDFGLHHPELREVTARLRFFGAKRRPEAIHFAERRGGGFDVQLSRLREIGLAEVEVVHREERAGVLADRSRQDGGVHEREMPLVEEIANRLYHLVTYARDRDLLFGP